ncbi:MAG: phosphoribosyltransferase family protein [Dolichospermum sp.]
MITLDLVNPEKSQIKYKISQFPDGQQTVDLTDWNDLYRNDAVKISSRLNTFRDLELIICATAAVRNFKPNREIALYVPYFMGARSDRKFVEGGVNYLKQVICPIINSLNFTSVVVLDPHSDVLEACLNNYEKIDNHKLVKHALTKIDNKDGAQDRICLVSPDAGAYKKIFDVAKKFGIENIITATKVRDMRSGNILRTEIPTLNQHDDLKYVIIDDICDGGRTFIELAKAIKGSRPTAKVYLVVTHGIFTAGFEQLNQYFEGIYTTNSYVDMNDPEFSIKNDNNLHKLTQFNVI